MVISGVNTVIYNGDGINKAWPYTYPVTDEDEIKIQLNNADGTAVIITSDYYVDMVNSTVYYPGYAPGSEPPEADQPPTVQPGQKITVYRDIPITQEANLGNSWPFSVIEFSLDKLTMICQQIYSYTDRKLDASLAAMMNIADTIMDADKLQQLVEELKEIEQYTTAAEASATAAEASAESASDDATSAAASATSASTSATNAATSATSAAASASSAASVAETLTDIYNDAIDQGLIAAPAVDNTLSIVGAAADAKVTGVDINLLNDTEDGVLRNITQGHFYRIRPLGWSDMTRYHLTNHLDPTSIDELTPAVKACDYTLCPKNLCLYFPDSNARCYMYFYSLSGGVYTPIWSDDLVNMNTTVSPYVKNYLNLSLNGGVPTMMVADIPDGTYFRFRSDVGNVELYAWDGVLFDGLPIAADSGYPSSDGQTVEILRSSGGFGITISGTTKYLLSDGTYAISAISAISDNDSYVGITDVTKRFYKLPSGYKYFRLRMAKSNETRTGDVNNHVIAVGTNRVTGATYGRAIDVEKTAKTYCDLEWTAAADLRVRTYRNEPYKFHTGVKYNGFPYAEDWLGIHFVGWHVSLHTALNAMNDANSIFYNEHVDLYEQPWYGNVCSSFATLVSGWPYPQINAGFVYDPDCLVQFSPEPVIGQPYTRLSPAHCFITVGMDQYPNGDKAITAYDGTRPTNSKTVRWSLLRHEIDKSGYKNACGANDDGTSWYSGYGYAAHHKDAKTDLSLVPYLDFTDTSLTNGDARPYKGDKCVYTSEEDHVYINIKNSATRLYMRKGLDGEVFTIVTGGAARIDVKPHLTGAGIYYVYTNTSATEESFEYVIPGSVTVTLDSNKKIVSTTGDFWYMVTLMYGGHLRPGASQCCIPMKDDYSGWNRDGQYVQEVRAVFGKATYGAYNIPFTAGTPITPDDPDDPGDDNDDDE